jgi:hypothetical protein
MEWWGYPFESLPTSFQSDNLVELIMLYSCIKQPVGWKEGKILAYANVFSSSSSSSSFYSSSFYLTIYWSSITEF